MNVIFLDFDGVLNNNQYFVNSKDQSPFILDDAKMLLLKQIIDATNSKIVLSTSWREVWDLDLPITHQLIDYFESFGIEIYGKTENIEYNRVLEIKNWITHHNVTNYCILDDIPGPWFELEEHVVITNTTHDGLTEDNVKRAIEILKK